MKAGGAMSKSDDGAEAASLSLATDVPLNAVRVFVEAARQASLSRAARRLGMTQSGVSHHMATLERYFGRRLFVRGPAGVSLTDSGRIYYDAVHEALAAVELATRQLAAERPGAEMMRLVVRTSLPSFAAHVLIPALAKFTESTGVAVDVLTSLAPPEPGERYDVLVTRDLAVDAATHWQLAGEVLVCVAAPSLGGALAGVPVSEWPFLVARSRPDVLTLWAARQGIDAPQVRVVAGFEHYYLAIAAALGGLGVLVVPRLLVRDLLGSGSGRGLLVDLGRPEVRGDAFYKAGVNPVSAAPETAVAFCRWLCALLKGDGGG